jgi:hypothetical protein
MEFGGVQTEGFGVQVARATLMYVQSSTFGVLR